MDKIFNSWLDRQHADATALAADSDRLAVLVRGEISPQDFIVHIDCRTMVRAGGEVEPWDDGCVVLFHFPLDYLRVVAYPELIPLLLEPKHIFHPNVSPHAICVGHIAPGTSLVELIYRVHDVLTFAKVTPSENNAFSPAACAWARANMQRFPVDERPLRRRVIDFDVSPDVQGSGA